MITLGNSYKKPEDKNLEQKDGFMLTLRQANKMKRWNKHRINNFWEHLENVGRVSDGRVRLGPYENINNIWLNEPCYVVGGSISARGFDLNLLDGKHTIGLNHMIEVYDGFEWFLFMDQRFMRISKYDISKYKGKIFAHNNTQLNNFNKPENVVLFKCNNKRPSLRIEDGLFNRSLTGLAGLNLAIITGANPIYMIGMDIPKGLNIDEGIHYNEDYTGEHRAEKSLKGYIGRYEYFKHFIPYKDRIVNCTIDGYMDWFKRMDIKDLENRLRGAKNDT